MARKKARTAKQKAATAKMLRANKRARSAGKRKTKSSGKRKSAKRAAAGRKAARTRKRNKAEHKAAGRKGARRTKARKVARKGGKRRGAARSSNRSSHRSSTRVVKQTIVKHVPTGGLLVQAPKRSKRRKAKRAGKRHSGRKGARKGTRRAKRSAAMENPMTTGELILGGFTGLLGFLTADVVDRMLATHALTDKGTKDLQGNELYADNPPSSGDYTGLYNATAICAPMDVTRWLVGVGAVAGLPLVLAHFVKNDMARSGLQFFGFAAGVRIVGKGLTDLVAGVLKTNPIGQQLYDGEMRAAALKANNGNPAAAALASLPSAGLGRPRLGAAAPCAPCATGAGYPSMPREVASGATQSAPPQNSTPSTQMAPPAAPPPAAPPAPVFNQVSTLTGVPGTKNRFVWGDPNSQ